VARSILTDPEAMTEFAQQQQPALYGAPEEIEALIKNSLTGLTPERQKQVQSIISDEFY